MARSMTVLIAYEDDIYKNHNAPGMVADMIGILRAGRSEKYTERILWNSVRSYAHLNQDARERAQKGKILTEFLFPRSGVYRLKARLLLPGQEKVSILETSPITIVINEPAGEDLAFWNAIKDRGDLAYFMQSGQIRSYKKDERAKTFADVEELINRFPNSSFTPTLKKSRTRHLEMKEISRKAKEKRDLREQRRKEGNKTTDGN